MNQPAVATFWLGTFSGPSAIKYYLMKFRPLKFSIFIFFKVLTNSISVHVLRATLGHVYAVDRDCAELVVHVRLQASNRGAVVDDLRVGDEPLALALQPVLDEEMRARIAVVVVRIPRHLNVCQAIIRRQSIPTELRHVRGCGRAASRLRLDKVTKRGGGTEESGRRRLILDHKQ